MGAKKANGGIFVSADWVTRAVRIVELFDSVMSVVDMSAMILEEACGIYTSFDAQVLLALAVTIFVATWRHPSKGSV